MAIYAIGDVQGCFDDLQFLLAKINYNKAEDLLWFAGDLVNRGPDSLAVLRFVKSLGPRAVTVLGNHDLHLLAIAAGYAKLKQQDTIAEILDAPDCQALLDWLRSQPLLHHDAQTGYTMLHAGLPPQWGLDEARACAGEVEALLRSSDYQDFFKHMYGNKPDLWSNKLSGWERKRFIVNCFSRLRYCDINGKLALNEKAVPGTQTSGNLPWFEVPDRLSKGLKIIFGHWSTLRLYPVEEEGVYPIDTGCVWGEQLTAIKVQDKPEFFEVDCKGACTPG